MVPDRVRSQAAVSDATTTSNAELCSVHLYERPKCTVSASSPLSEREEVSGLYKITMVLKG